MSVSSIAGRYLVKEPTLLQSKDVTGRFMGETLLKNMYPKMCVKGSLYQALNEWGVVAKDTGVSKAASIYRWSTYDIGLEA